ncbi:MAG: SET domain-containing protein-lysine N-methyltransferase [bacterium]|nr:SET domain-containing protein-lysine N-methyltransferase [bacterium]
MDKTDRFSFILRPSTIQDAGIGVFALHDIVKDTYMELFLPDFQEEIVDPKDIPEELQMYCLDKEDAKLQCPKYFNRMDIGNYLNHGKDANLRWEEGTGYFAVRDINKGEELFANYKELGEPEGTRDKYMVA